MRSNAPRALDWARPRETAQRATYLEPEEERQLITRASHDPRALARLVDAHMRLVISIAQRHAHHGVDAEDLIAEGTIGLLEAIRRFDPSQQVRLSTYARWWIRARVRSYSLANRRLVAMPSTRVARLALSKLATLERGLTQQLGRVPHRGELAEALAVGIEELDGFLLALTVRDLYVSDEQDAPLPDADHAATNPERALAEAQDRAQFDAAVRKTLPVLTVRQRRVFEAQLAEDEDATLLDLSVELGVTRQRVSQIAASVRERLRRNLVAAPRAS